MKLGMYMKQPILIGNSSRKEFQFIKNFVDIQDIISNKRTIVSSDLNLSDLNHFHDLNDLDAPIEHPRQIFAVGFNYRDHSKELQTKLPSEPNIFTKFVSSLTGPSTTITLPSNKTDWETELVIVVGKGGRNIQIDDAQNHIAGYMVGQDLSDRQLQFKNSNPQFSLAKSYANFSPTGPWITTTDQIDNLTNLKLTTKVNNVTKQKSTLGNLIFDDNALVSYLSKIVELYPGDLIFTGTPGGVGVGRNPQEFLQSGDYLTSQIDELGTLELSFI